MDVTFRLLVDNMPALRELHLYISRQPSQDGFIELVSRLQSLSLIARGQPWDVVRDERACPLTLPNLKELRWSTGGENADPVAVAVLRRAVSLRAADVSHASALAAIAAGSHAIAVDCNVDPCMHYAPLANLQKLVAVDRTGDSCMHFAPLAHVQNLTLNAVINDPLSLAEPLAASPRASTVKLRWEGSGHGQWDLLRAVASAALPSDDSAAGRCMRVRRVRLEVECVLAEPDPEAAVRCVRALFPRARYASWSLRGDDYPLLPLLPACLGETFP
jgi:hypothetical protein